MGIKTVTKENWEEIMNTEQTVLIDFWASWCGPCKMLSPLVDEVAEEVGDHAVVGKVNVDEQPELAEKYNVMSIPTLLAFRKGEVVGTSVGVVAKEKIQELLSL